MLTTLAVFGLMLAVATVIAPWIVRASVRGDEQRSQQMERATRSGLGALCALDMAVFMFMMGLPHLGVLGLLGGVACLGWMLREVPMLEEQVKFALGITKQPPQKASPSSPPDDERPADTSPR